MMKVLPICGKPRLNHLKIQKRKKLARIEYSDLILEEFRDTDLYSLNSSLKYFGSYSKPQRTITKFERQFIKERREIYYLSYIKTNT